MIPKQIARRLGATLVLSGMTALGLAFASQAADLPARADRAMSSAACKEAMQSAWFERQRQITEGDTDSTRALPSPRECRQIQGANDEDGKRERVAARAQDRDAEESPRK